MEVTETSIRSYGHFYICTPFIDTKGMLCLFQGLNGFSLGILFPLFLGMAVETISLEKRATAMGAYQAIYAIGCSLDLSLQEY